LNESSIDPRMENVKNAEDSSEEDALLTQALIEQESRAELTIYGKDIQPSTQSPPSKKVS
jgi:hypothetical protein